jgi:endoglucanase
MIMPHEEKEELIISPVSTTATGDFAASMAMASRFYAASDPGFSRRMLDAAIRAWDFLQRTEPILFCNPEGVSTGGYGDRSDEDERLWAHVELALTCGEPYLSAAREALLRYERRDVSLGWADVSGYAALEGLLLPLVSACLLCISGALGELCLQLPPAGAALWSGGAAAALVWLLLCLLALVCRWEER